MTIQGTSHFPLERTECQVQVLVGIKGHPWVHQQEPPVEALSYLHNQAMEPGEVMVRQEVQQRQREAVMVWRQVS